jgi:hypothetical protein
MGRIPLDFAACGADFPALYHSFRSVREFVRAASVVAAVGA